MDCRESSCRLSRPCVAFGDAELIQHAAVDAAEDLPHKFDSAVGNEIGAVDVDAADLWREEAGAVNVPCVIGLGRGSDERRTMGKAGAAKAARAEVLEAG